MGPSPNPEPSPNPQPSPPQPTSPPSPVAGTCTRQDDCSISAWCNDPAYIQWCPQQWTVGYCPEPQCKKSEATSPRNCTDLPLSSAWAAGGNTCATYYTHGGRAYCAHEELQQACCFCPGGGSDEKPEEPEFCDSDDDCHSDEMCCCSLINTASLVTRPLSLLQHKASTGSVTTDIMLQHKALMAPSQTIATEESQQCRCVKASSGECPKLRTVSLQA